MAKEVYATIRIKNGPDTFIEPGEQVNPADLSKEDLQEFYDRGFIEVREVSEAKPAKGPETKVEAPKEEPKKDAK